MKNPRKKALWTTLRGGLKPRTLFKPNTTRLKKGSRSASAAVLRTLRPAPRARIKSRSKVMRGKMAYYNIRKRVFLEAHPSCDACHKLAGAITTSYPIQKAVHPATEIHHLRGRAGKLLLDERFWVGVCADAHRFIHDRPEVARKAGLLAQPGEWGKQK